ncbi:MAG: ribonuclease III [Lachnospiraceae bacterium]|nr:ribonuclease III [Lachnospiraceae bacterium]
MEENLRKQIAEAFGKTGVDVHTYSPLTLAYIGDCIYEVIIRTEVLMDGNKQTEKLHRDVTKLVKAETQCKLIPIWEELLTEEEKDIVRRGRNSRSYTKAKNASINHYRKATGVEALIGYLYLTDRMPRAIYLVKEGLDRIAAEEGLRNS